MKEQFEALKKADDNLMKAAQHFASEAQRKFMWAVHPEIAEKWAHGEHAGGKGPPKKPSKRGLGVHSKKAGVTVETKEGRKKLREKRKKKKKLKKSTSDTIYKFFQDNPHPDDEQLHSFAQSIGATADDVEENVYGALSSIITGGESGKKGITEKDVNQKEFAMGKKVEMEHIGKITPCTKKIAAKIALDHLAEIPDYYTRLKKMEEQAMKK